MKDYKIENLELLNQKSNLYVGNFKIYSWMSEFSQADKLEFIDKYWTDKNGETGLGTYMYNMITKWENEKDGLPHDQWGDVKTVSLKAWLKKNDTKQIVDNCYHHGTYYMIGREYYSLSTTVNPTWTSSAYYNGKEGKIVDQWFYDLLSYLEGKEGKWAKDHNPTVLKIRKIYEYGKIYGAFNIKKFGLVVGNGERVLDRDWRRRFNEPEITESDIDEMLKVYEEVDNLAKAKTKEIVDRLGWEVYTD